MERTGSRAHRLALSLTRSLGIGLWRLGERLGLDLVGASEGPPVRDDAERRQAFDRLIAAAEASDGVVDAGSCPYPVHEFLTYLVDRHGLLLHGSNHAGLEVLVPQRARDLDTELLAVVACDDGIWPMFYAVVARDDVHGVVTACTHLRRGTRRRRLYVFGLFAGPSSPWSAGGVVYALPRDGFRREWGNEWVSAEPVRPRLRVRVAPEDFPLLDTVVELSSPAGVRSVLRDLRAAKRARATTS